MASAAGSDRELLALSTTGGRFGSGSAQGGSKRTWRRRRWPWRKYGRNYDNNRYSPLNQINTGNVDKLKLAYTLQLGALRSNESTPIVIPSRTVVPAWTSQRRRGGARGPDTTIMASVLQALHRIGVEPDREHG
jgi:hypothetical protein